MRLSAGRKRMDLRSVVPFLLFVFFFVIIIFIHLRISPAPGAAFGEMKMQTKKKKKGRTPLNLLGQRFPGQGLDFSLE